MQALLRSLLRAELRGWGLHCWQQRASREDKLVSDNISCIAAAAAAPGQRETAGMLDSAPRMSVTAIVCGPRQLCQRFKDAMSCMLACLCQGQNVSSQIGTVAGRELFRNPECPSGSFAPMTNLFKYARAVSVAGKTQFSLRRLI